MHAYVYVCACMRVNVHVYMCVYVCMYVCVYVCIYIYIHTRVGVNMRSCRRILFICTVQSLYYMRVYHKCLLVKGLFTKVTKPLTVEGATNHLYSITPTTFVNMIQECHEYAVDAYIIIHLQLL